MRSEIRCSTLPMTWLIFHDILSGESPPLSEFLVSSVVRRPTREISEDIAHNLMILLDFFIIGALNTIISCVSRARTHRISCIK